MIIGTTAAKIARARFTPFAMEQWHTRQSAGCFPGGPYYFDVFDSGGIIGSELEYTKAEFIAHIPDDLRAVFHYIDKLEEENATLKQNIRNMVP